MDETFQSHSDDPLTYTSKEITTRTLLTSGNNTPRLKIGYQSRGTDEIIHYKQPFSVPVE